MNASAKDLHPTLVVGLGKTGVSCVRFLLQQGKAVKAVDSRADPPGLEELLQDYPQLQYSLGPFAQQEFEQAEEIVLSPGVAMSIPQVQAAQRAGVTCVGDVELFARHARAPVVAVTGSNGKSTVVSLIAGMLEAGGLRVALGGNIGTPVLELLRGPEPDYYVLELSSFQLETTLSLNAAVSVILNLTEDHMDRYQSFTQYCEAKARVYQGDGVIVAANDETAVQQLLPDGRKVLFYGKADTETVPVFAVESSASEAWISHRGEPVLTASQLRLQGRHNLYNVAAAMTVCEALGVAVDTMCRFAAGFCGLPHRMQFVAEHRGVRWINDSKGTNVGATVAAVQGLNAKTVLIAGGIAKDADFSALAPVLAQHAHGLILFGRDAGMIAQAVDQVVPVQFAVDLDDAVVQAAGLAQPGEIVLLSPACASFDMFSDFEDRGRQFIRAVKKYISNECLENSQR